MQKKMFPPSTVRQRLLGLFPRVFFHKKLFHAGRSLATVFLLSLLALVVGCTSTQTFDEQPLQQQSAKGYVDLTSVELSELMASENVYLVDTHIPEQQHIQGTDAFIPYNEILARAEELPRDAKIVLYCRSGSMSEAAATELAEAGFTNVYNLLGGANDWRDNGLPFV